MGPTVCRGSLIPQGGTDCKGDLAVASGRGQVCNNLPESGWKDLRPDSGKGISRS